MKKKETTQVCCVLIINTYTLFAMCVLQCHNYDGQR